MNYIMTNNHLEKTVTVAPLTSHLWAIATPLTSHLWAIATQPLVWWMEGTAHKQQALVIRDILGKLLSSGSAFGYMAWFPYPFIDVPLAWTIDIPSKHESTARNDRSLVLTALSCSGLRVHCHASEQLYPDGRAGVDEDFHQVTLW